MCRHYRPSAPELPLVFNSRGTSSTLAKVVLKLRLLDRARIDLLTLHMSKGNALPCCTRLGGRQNWLMSRLCVIDSPRHVSSRIIASPVEVHQHLFYKANLLRFPSIRVVLLRFWVPFKDEFCRGLISLVRIITRFQFPSLQMYRSGENIYLKLLAFNIPNVPSSLFLINSEISSCSFCSRPKS